MEIIDYPNYLIYSDGRVFNKKYNRFLKSNINRYGYQYIDLYYGGKRKKYVIHRLIAIHYIPNPENKPEVDHINRIKTDNRIENLRWVNRSKNNLNKGKQKNNKSGHKYISYDKFNDRWVFQKMINNKRVCKYFKTKTEALCYKFICIIKHKIDLKI